MATFTGGTEMTDKPPEICPHCGHPANEKFPTHPPAEAREYDYRGVLMPQRTRIGGIIIPQ
jgi:hypothetical protein